MLAPGSPFFNKQRRVWFFGPRHVASVSMRLPSGGYKVENLSHNHHTDEPNELL